MSNFKSVLVYFFIFFTFLLPLQGDLYVGLGEKEITPTLNTPSAGYQERKGKPMQGIHDPLLATALFIETGDTSLVFCSVDHLGFTYSMFLDIQNKIQEHPGLKNCKLFIGSSHTHSGGGAYLDIPQIGELLAGAYSKEITQFYINRTTDAIIEAWKNKIPAKIGIAQQKMATSFAHCRVSFPKMAEPLDILTILKFVDTDDQPLAVLANFALHPTIHKGDNFLFSADFVGDMRKNLSKKFGERFKTLYFNGAQAEIVPKEILGGSSFEASEKIGNALGEEIFILFEKTITKNVVDINVVNDSYVFVPQENSFGMKLPVNTYSTEINALLLDKNYLFITIPGELSSFYEASWRKYLIEKGLSHFAVLGLTNDAHGYILVPEAWEQKTTESKLSFGGKEYGPFIEKKVFQMAEKFITENFQKLNLKN